MSGILDPIPFEKGDLVYGLDASRYRLLKHKILERKFTRVSSHPIYTVALMGPMAFIDDLTSERREADYSVFKLAKKVRQHPTGSRQKALQFSKFLTPLENKEGKALSASDVNKQTKRDCKYGMIWTLLNQHRIHFALANLDIPSIFNKKHPHAQSFTSVEVRFIYRYWESFFKIFYEKGDLIFYSSDGQISAAPWIENATLGSGYIPLAKTLSECLPDMIKAADLLTTPRVKTPAYSLDHLKEARNIESLATVFHALATEWHYPFECYEEIVDTAKDRALALMTRDIDLKAHREIYKKILGIRRGSFFNSKYGGYLNKDLGDDTRSMKELDQAITKLAH